MDIAFIPLVVGLVRGRDRVSPVVTGERDDHNTGIRCPSCGWRPARHDAWRCAPGCGEVWNTFETRGECPGCEKFWAQTQCLRCGAWSPHDLWYESRPED
jgi:hypothetical protein